MTATIFRAFCDRDDLAIQAKMLSITSLGDFMQLSMNEYLCP
jgi:hypothetical protein